MSAQSEERAGNRVHGPAKQKQRIHCTVRETVFMMYEREEP